MRAMGVQWARRHPLQARAAASHSPARAPAERAARGYARLQCLVCNIRHLLVNGFQPQKSFTAAALPRGHLGKCGAASSKRWEKRRRSLKNKRWLRYVIESRGGCAGGCAVREQQRAQRHAAVRSMRCSCPRFPRRTQLAAGRRSARTLLTACPYPAAAFGAHRGHAAPRRGPRYAPCAPSASCAICTARRPAPALGHVLACLANTTPPVMHNTAAGAGGRLARRRDPCRRRHRPREGPQHRPAGAAATALAARAAAAAAAAARTALAACAAASPAAAAAAAAGGGEGAVTASGAAPGAPRPAAGAAAGSLAARSAAGQQW